MSQNKKNNKPGKTSKKFDFSKDEQIIEKSYNQLPDFRFTPPVPEPKKEETRAGENEDQ